MIQAPSSPLVISVGPLKLDFTLCACGAMIRNRARPSELICGYCLPPWFKDDGLKSSTAGWVVCPEAGRFAVASNRARDNSAVLIEMPPDSSPRKRFARGDNQSKFGFGRRISGK